MRQAVRLWTDYAIGAGLTFQAEGGAQKVLEKFWRNRRNRPVARMSGQRQSSQRLLVDGDVFFAIFGSDVEGKTIRRVDPLQVVKILTDPDDEGRVFGYRRQYVDRVGQPRTLYYRDWGFSDGDVVTDDDPGKGKVTWEENVVVYHVALDPVQQWGQSLLGPVCSWSREHRRFMEARVALTQALARYAWKGKAKAGASTLETLRKQLASTVSLSQTEGNPPRVAGSTWLENAGLELTPFSKSTGGAEARNDADLLKLMVCAGTGVFLHYFGDPSTGNLATATAMELPMLKMFHAYQQLWLDVYADLFAIALGETDDDETERTKLDLDLPPVVEPDLAGLADALQKLDTSIPGFGEQRDVLQVVLVALGVNDVDRIVKELEGRAKERRAATPAPNPELDAQLKALAQAVREATR